MYSYSLRMCECSSHYPRSTTMKTYSRRVNSNVDGPSKKRKRPDEFDEPGLPYEKPKVARRSIQDYFHPKQITPTSPSSSISLKQNSSDPLEPASTPPSSPPAKLSTTAHKLQQKSRRRLSSRPNVSKLANLGPPSSGDENDEPVLGAASEKLTGRNALRKRPPLKPTATNLQQVQLDLGVSAMKQCKACGMEYNSTIPEDRKLHDEFHKRKHKATQPIRMSSNHIFKSTQVDGESYEMRLLDCRGPVSSRAHFEQALEIMYGDLSGDQITNEDLWSEIPNPIKSSVLNKVPRFTVLMLLVDRIPAAILIVERISKAGGYLDDFRSSQTEVSVNLGERSKGYGKPDVIKLAHISVERIWVDKEHRRKGLATTLINHARKVLIPGLEIKRSQVAFSWPTTLGRSLATRYSVGQHDEAIPFLVNLADCPDV